MFTPMATKLDPRNLDGIPGPSPVVAVKVPSRQTAQLDSLASSEGVTRSEIVRRAITHYLAEVAAP